MSATSKNLYDFPNDFICIDGIELRIPVSINTGGRGKTHLRMLYGRSMEGDRMAEMDTEGVGRHKRLMTRRIEDSTKPRTTKRGRGWRTRRRQVTSDTASVGRSIDSPTRIDIPFEFVGEVASTRAMAEASHVEGSTSSRHDGRS